ncbi:MAG: Uxx-star family glutaredoxin-like (seleno)protein [Patescibacteria group bacterium]|jgi:glutaredoxin-like YruB-family protein|nr:Uxx-star family glutaredoxin-like (seleno)protein [Patescibacteria group bacterium]
MHVTIYTTPTCPYCKLAKDFFKEKGIAFSEIDVASDPAAANEMVKKSGQMGVPVIEVNSQIVVGWNQAALQEIMEKNGKKAKATA